MPFTWMARLLDSWRHRSDSSSIRYMRRQLLRQAKKEQAFASTYEVGKGRIATLELAPVCKARLESFSPVTVRAMFKALGIDGYSVYKTLLQVELDENEVRIRSVVKALMQDSSMHAPGMHHSSYMAVAGTLEAALSAESWIGFANLDKASTEHARILLKFTAPFIRRAGYVVRLLPSTSNLILERPEIIEDLIRYAEERGIRDPYEIDAGRYMAGLETASPSLRDGAL